MSAGENTVPNEPAPAPDTVPGSAAKKRGWKTKVFVAKIVLSLGLLIAVVFKVRPTLPSLEAIDWWAITLAVALLIIQPLLIAWRWRFVLRAFGENLPLVPLVKATWVSVLAGQFLPASVGGDLVRMLFMRSAGINFAAMASSVIIDRAVALVGISVLAIVFCPLLLNVGDPSMVQLTAIVAGLGILCVPVLAALAGPVERRVTKYKWLSLVAVLLRYVRTFLTRPVLAGAALVIALAVHALSVAALVVIAQGLGIHVAPIHLVGVSVVITFAMAIPISIGGWGIREAVAVTLLGFFSVSADKALLAALLLGLCYAAASMPGAAIWFLRDKTPRAGETSPPTAPA